MSKRSDARHWTFDAAVMDVAADARGAHIAVGLADGRIGLIDRRRGSLSLRQTHLGAAQCVVHDPVNDRFVSGGDDGRLVSTCAGADPVEIARLGSRWIESVVVDPVGGSLFAAMGSQLFVVGPAEPRVFAKLASTPGALSWDASSAGLLSPHYGGVSRHKLNALSEAPDVFEWKGAHLAASVSPDGRWLVSATQEAGLHVWPTSGSEDMGMRGYASKPLSMAWTAGSALLLTSGLDSLCGWSFDGDGPRGREPKMLGWGGGGLASRVVLHPSAPIALTGFDNGAVIFTDLGLEEYGVIEPARGQEVTGLVWTDDGRAVVIASEDGRVSVYDV